jgi:hypothetical protein
MLIPDPQMPARLASVEGVSVAGHACGNDGASSPTRGISAPGQSELRQFRLQGRAIGRPNLVTRDLPIFAALRGHAGQPGPRAENRERGEILHHDGPLRTRG